MLPHNAEMSNSGRLIICGLLLLTGCQTGQRPGNVNRVPDWEVISNGEPESSVGPERLPPSPPVILPTNAPAPASPLINRFPEIWVSLDRWSQSNDFGGWQRLSPTASPTYRLTTGNDVWVIRMDNPAAYWNGLEVRLGFAPQLIDNRPYIHTLDLQKNILPLLDPVRVIGKTNRTIVIDPGHGGGDAGAKNVFNQRYEKDFTLDWAQRVGQLLATNGWRVVLTRTSDREMALTNRVALAERENADFFLSLHFNSAYPNQAQSGLETYCLTPVGMPSSLRRGYEDDPARAFPNNGFDTQNLQYAVRLHRALLKVNDNPDRGVRRARFLTVLRGQNRPAVLLEGGYLSNPREAQLIADPLHRQQLAEAVAKALTSDAGGQIVPSVSAASSRSHPPHASESSLTGNQDAQ